MKNLKKILIVGGMLVLILGMISCESWSRSIKSFKSDVGGGLERTVTVYDYNGNEIKKYEGKFDIQESESKVMFDVNGKRVQIYNAVVISEEK